MLAVLMERIQNYDNWKSYDQDQRSALMRYRQDLLDIEKQESFPNVLWPQPPF